MTGASAEVDSQLAAIDLLVDKSLLALHSALDIDEICVSKSSWLSSTSINGNTNINDIANVTEELVEIGIRHLEGEVANEESLGWRVVCITSARLAHVVYNDTAAFEEGLVFGLDRSFGLVNGLEFDISESVEQISVLILVNGDMENQTYPLLNPLASVATTVDLTLPYCPNSL